MPVFQDCAALALAIIGLSVKMCQSDPIDSRRTTRSRSSWPTVYRNSISSSVCAQREQLPQTHQRLWREWHLARGAYLCEAFRMANLTTPQIEPMCWAAVEVTTGTWPACSVWCCDLAVCSLANLDFNGGWCLTEGRAHWHNTGSSSGCLRKFSSFQV